MHLYKQLSVLYIQYTKIDFQLNSTISQLQCMYNGEPAKEIRVDILRQEIQRRMGEFGKQQLLEALHRNIESVTAAKGAQWYRFMFE